jgi:hypothetical protein
MPLKILSEIHRHISPPPASPATVPEQVRAAANHGERDYSPDRHHAPIRRALRFAEQGAALVMVQPVADLAGADALREIRVRERTRLRA